MDPGRSEALVVGVRDGVAGLEPGAELRRRVEGVGPLRRPRGRAGVRDAARAVRPADHRPAALRRLAAREHHEARDADRLAADARRAVEERPGPSGLRQGDSRPCGPRSGRRACTWRAPWAACRASGRRGPWGPWPRRGRGGDQGEQAQQGDASGAGQSLSSGGNRAHCGRFPQSGCKLLPSVAPVAVSSSLLAPPRSWRPPTPRGCPRAARQAGRLEHHRLVAAAGGEVGEQGHQLRALHVGLERPRRPPAHQRQPEERARRDHAVLDRRRAPAAGAGRARCRSRWERTRSS